MNAARRGDDPKLAIGRAKQPAGTTLADVWEAYGKAGYPLLNGIGFKRASSIKADGYRWKNQLSRLGHRPVAKIDTPEVQRWLDTIFGLGARSHALIQLKSLLRFAASRGLADTHKIAITPRPSRQIQNYLKPGELKRLDAALVKLIREQPGRMMGFAALRLMLHTGCARVRCCRSPGRWWTWTTAWSVWSATKRAAKTWAAIPAVRHGVRRAAFPATAGAWRFRVFRQAARPPPGLR